MSASLRFHDDALEIITNLSLIFMFSIVECDYNCFQHYTSECRISIVLLNKVNGNMQDDWAYKKSMCSHLPQFCNVTIGIWPGVSQPYYSLPGIIYGSELGQHATKCAYAFDGSSDMVTSNKNYPARF